MKAECREWLKRGRERMIWGKRGRAKMVWGSENSKNSREKKYNDLTWHSAGYYCMPRH